MRIMGWVWVTVLLWGWSAYAADVQISSTLSYDSNLYEALRKGQGGMSSRVSVTAKGVVWRGPKGAIQIEQQAGLQRLWSKALGQPQAGDVFVEQFFVHGVMPIGKGLFGIRSGLKFKEATRVPSEESYLRAGVDGDFAFPLGKRLMSRLRFGIGGDDSRDVLLPETHYETAGLDLTYSKQRNLSVHLRILKRWIDYDRLALQVNDVGQIAALKEKQRDRASSVTMGFQAFVGMLIQADYAFLRNQSNSFGYAYWAHRIQGMVVRHVGKGIDAQVFIQFHVRFYDEDFPTLLGGITETDAYEQSIAVLKLSRQISAKHTLSGQYGFYRNGARQGDGFYRKHLFSIVFETKM